VAGESADGVDADVVEQRQNEVTLLGGVNPERVVVQVRPLLVELRTSRCFARSR
jgi:hypothetical protein